ncbi:hypothetical protein D2V17_08680 [Aurantiacibacter xanthus]|uniref:Uncharacterized protein n=1 Tax=Aurantiacibacter xanthus TaxID=1784712 RepID=A0A3A1P8A5_9SPHN|nr:hypothetical protein [Aurantiacibacter xanthus]RIV87225.1 hypothetical protein D2V17_08680 [Aurantiacibacter xanthus]
MEWLVSVVVFCLALALLPLLLRRSRKSARKGTAGGVMMGLGLAFMTIFDPAKAESMEEIRERKDRGEADQGESGDKPD